VGNEFSENKNICSSTIDPEIRVVQAFILVEKTKKKKKKIRKNKRKNV
jgi:hypothetical protein